MRDRTVPQLLFLCLSHIWLVLLSNLIHFQCIRVILIIRGRKYELSLCFWETFCGITRVQATAQAHSACCHFSGEEKEWMSAPGVQLLAGEGEQGIAFNHCHFQKRGEKQRVPAGKDALKGVQIPQPSLGSRLVSSCYSQNSYSK